MTPSPLPLVSVGVPVFNGAEGIARCLDSILRQEYRNLEIIVSDNASTDATGDICCRYAAADPRIRYVRQPANRGGVWNFNQVCELATGAYFMWAAHDDVRDEAFVKECVAVLERNPDAVLCQAHTVAVMEDSGAPLYVVGLDTLLGVRSLSARYRATLRHLPATALYGLYRTSAMRRTRLINGVIASDLAFLQELSLYGRFVEVPRVLFHYNARASWNTIHQDSRHFLGRRKPWYYVPFVMLAIEHAKRVGRAPIPMLTKAGLWVTLAGQQLAHVAARVLVRGAGAVCPAGKKEWLGPIVYDRLLRNPNVQVIDPELFTERVRKPQLGWWK